jgi:hypothetical protein
MAIVMYRMHPISIVEKTFSLSIQKLACGQYKVKRKQPLAELPLAAFYFTHDDALEGV